MYIIIQKHQPQIKDAEAASPSCVSLAASKGATRSYSASLKIYISTDPRRVFEISDLQSDAEAHVLYTIYTDKQSLCKLDSHVCALCAVKVYIGWVASFGKIKFPVELLRHCLAAGVAPGSGLKFLICIRA